MPFGFFIAAKEEKSMKNEELNTKVYEKAFAEQEKFREWMLSQPTERNPASCL